MFSNITIELYSYFTVLYFRVIVNLPNNGKAFKMQLAAFLFNLRGKKNMAGSLRWFRYVDDSGNPFAIFADESNTELVNPVLLTSASVAGLQPLPKGVTPRSITLQDDSRDITRTAYVLTQERYGQINNALNFLLTPVNFSGVAADTPVSVILKNPEIQRRIPRNADTGLNDGDIP